MNIFPVMLNKDTFETGIRVVHENGFVATYKLTDPVPAKIFENKQHCV